MHFAGLNILAVYFNNEGETLEGAQDMALSLCNASSKCAEFTSTPSVHLHGVALRHKDRFTFMFKLFVTDICDFLFQSLSVK